MPTRQDREALRNALFAVQGETRLLWHQLAARMSLSRRTLQRYMQKESFPTPAVALAMLKTMTSLSAPVYAQLATALAVQESQRPAPTAPRAMTDEAPAAAAMALMLYAAAEASGVAPAAARKVATATLEHLAAHGLDVPTARRVLAASLASWPQSTSTHTS